MTPRFPLLAISGLSLSYPDKKEILSHISLQIFKYQKLGIAGASGSGKSSLLRAISAFLPVCARTEGTVALAVNPPFSLLQKNIPRKLIARHIAFMMQDSLGSLNPFLRIGQQMENTICFFLNCSEDTARRETLRWLNAVGFPDPSLWLSKYPSALSGGMKQRVSLALALCGGQKILVLDEPTTALDSIHKRQIAELLNKIAAEEKLTLLCASHDLPFLGAVCDRMMVLHNGRVAEFGSSQDILTHPASPAASELVENTKILQGIKKL